MNKSLLRLILTTQLFLLVALALLPLMIRYFDHPLVRLLYGLIAAGTIALAVLSRRAFAGLE